MKIIICGAGLLGVTTAYVLASRGHEVEIIERQPKAAEETSFANGGQLSYCHAEPWANPDVLKKLPKWLLHEDSPLIFRPSLDVNMYRWGTYFLRNCTNSKAAKNCINMLHLGLYSRKKMTEIRALVPLEFDFLNKGILHIYSNERDLEQAIEHMHFQEPHGCQQFVMTPAEALEKEPALAATSRKIIGAIHSPQDESGDPKKFTEQLAQFIQQKFSVQIHYNTSIQRIKEDKGAIQSIVTDKGEFKADAYVMALGSYTSLLLSKIGIYLPIYPMKGYSITVPAKEDAPSMSITDGTYKIVYSKLGNRMRVAGTAEFAGYDTQVRPSRIAPIVRAAKELFPGVDWDNQRMEWACLRPSTPDGAPRIGSTKYANLFLNTGHGTLGWTQAAGSAYIIADIIDKKTPEIKSNGFNW